jgi:hypothetical protein
MARVVPDPHPHPRQIDDRDRPGRQHSNDVQHPHADTESRSARATTCSHCAILNRARRTPIRASPQPSTTALRITASRITPRPSTYSFGCSARQRDRHRAA